MQALLERLDHCRLVLPITERSNLGLLGSEADRPFRNRLQTRWLARQCAEWITRKTELRGAPALLPQSTLIVSHEDSARCRILTGNCPFTTDGLGLTPGNNQPRPEAVVLRRPLRKIREENPLFAGDLGFRVFKLASSNIRAWEPDRENIAETLEASIEHLKADRTEQDILFELLLKLGLNLCAPIERKKVKGGMKKAQEIHSIGGGSPLVCLSPAIPQGDVEPLALGLVAWHKALKPAGETTVVFRDSAFADDVAKTNLTAILDQHGLGNVRSL